MLNQFKLEQRAKERKAIQASRILAQAKAPAKNGGVVVVVVYEMSNEFNYFFRYSAKSSRSPRKSWALTGWGGINDGRKFRDKNQTPSLNNYLARLSWEIAAGANWKIRYPHRKINLTNNIDRVSNPMKYTTPTLPAGATFGYASAKTSGRRPSKQDYAAYNQASIRYDDLKDSG